jgi:hypothetical protein
MKTGLQTYFKDLADVTSLNCPYWMDRTDGLHGPNGR